MCRNRIQPLFAWLFLLYFGLGNTLFAGGMVVCKTGDGAIRLEWGCERDGAGGCASGVDGGSTDEEPGDPEPCQDTPVAEGLRLAKAPPRAETGQRAADAMDVAVIVVRVEPPVRVRAAWIIPGPDRPPDAIAYIRTVVLIV